MISNDPMFARRLLKWYDRSRRDLPWRARPGSACDPYHVFLSEAMLQQTQVVTVIPYFLRFIQKFPKLQDLAAASEQSVLRLWQGLGYYSRARNLLRAAREIVQEHHGKVPRDVQNLLNLPGVGRYTAGAIASIAFDVRASIVDGNVARVICRLEHIRSDPREPKTRELIWQRAAQILPQRRCGDFNSALMELGATVCTPRSPACDRCPVRAACQAFAAGAQERIPPPRKSKAIPLVRRSTLCVSQNRNGTTRWLIEQRPPTGRWAGLWQFITAKTNGAPVTSRTVLGVAGVKSSRPRKLANFEHALSHRKYRFDVYLCRTRGSISIGAKKSTRRWVSLDQLRQYPLSRPQTRIARMLANPDNS